MKQFILLSLAITCMNLIMAQNAMESVLKTYFRTHPFDMKFSSFIQSLQKDPWFTIDAYDRRTDTSFFYLSGTYKNFNPLRYVPNELRLIVAETQFSHSDSIKTIDTVINMQLMAIADTGINNQKSVIKEFKRFHNSQSHYFSFNTYEPFNSNSGALVAEVYNYFISPLTISPISAAWGQLPDTHEYTFTITIRFKVNQNIADLIVDYF